MSRKITLAVDRKVSKAKSLVLLFGLMLVGFVSHAQISIDCLYPFVPTPCQGWIDSSPNMVAVTTDCNAGYTLTIGDPVLISGSGSCPGATYTVTYTATDNCQGASASCSQTWVIDNDGPTLNCPMDLYLTCGDPLNLVHIEQWLGSVDTDVSCLLGSNSFNTYNPNWINGPCLSSFQTVTFFVTDACGRSATCSATVFVSDTDPPVLEQAAEDLLEVCSYNTPMDFQNWINNHGGAVANDACSNVSWSTIPANPQLPLACLKTQVTFVATDGCGWSVSTTANFELIDCHPPVITGQPNDMTVDCEDDVDAALNDWLNSNGGAIAEDACGEVIWMSDPMNPELSDGCGNTGSVTVVFIAKDNCGNEALSDPATFTVVDNSPPVFTFVPADMTLDCNDDPVFGTPEAEDACGSVTITMMDSETGGSCDGTATRTWTATDECGNTATASQTITFSDTNPPVFTSVPDDEDIECIDEVTFGTPEANDDCGTVTITHEDQTNLAVQGGFSGNQEVPPSGSGGSGTVLGTYNPDAGKLTLDITFTGLTGNTAAAHIHTGILGSNGPVVFPLPIPTDVTEGSFSYMVDLDQDQATDLVAGFYYINIHTSETPSGEIRAQLFVKPCIGSSTRTWTATDECGNTATASQTINFEDTEGPVATDVPADITIECGDPIEFGDDPTWTDNCDTDVFSSSEDFVEPGDCPNESIHTRAWSAIDDCGTLTVVKQRIFVEDNEGPVFTFVPADATAECPDDIQLGQATAEDGCGGAVNITFEDTPSGAGCDLSMTRTWTATDVCGNSSTASQTVTVNDNTPPVFTYVPPVLDITCSVPPFDWEEPIAEDNCGGDVTLTYVEQGPNGTICFEGAAYVRVYTATDACGNSASVDVTVWVGPDQGAPVFTFVPQDLTFYCIDGDPVFPPATAVDDCDPNVVITFEDEFMSTPDNCGNGYGYDIVRTWTATDHCGNTTTAITLAWVKGPLSFGGTNGLVTNGNGEAELENLFELSPNPASEILNIVYGSVLEQKATIRIFNILGKEVISNSETAVKGLNNASFEISHFTQGTYLISIELGDKVLTKKFIKR